MSLILRDCFTFLNELALDVIISLWQAMEFLYDFLWLILEIVAEFFSKKYARFWLVMCGLLTGVILASFMALSLGQVMHYSSARSLVDYCDMRHETLKIRWSETYGENLKDVFYQFILSDLEFQRHPKSSIIEICIAYGRIAASTTRFIARFSLFVFDLVISVSIQIYYCSWHAAFRNQ